MKLSQLVDYRNQLKAMACSAAYRDSLRPFMHTIDSVSVMDEVAMKPTIDLLEQELHKVDQVCMTFEKIIDKLRQQIDAMIEEQEKPYFQESYRLYDEEMSKNTPDHILQKVMYVDPIANKLIKARIGTYTDWRFPGMIIRPGKDDIIHDMVACDPLYLVDTHHDLIKPSLDKFNQIYKNRLRPYIIHESTDHPMLTELPQGQFGLILIYNFFNYKPLELIKLYLNELYAKLRPGGHIIMTYNNCDLDRGVILVENKYQCYTPGGLVQDLAKSIGYEVKYVWDESGSISWLELQKPGRLVSLRGGQTLATVMNSS